MVTMDPSVYNGVSFPVHKLRITMPFKATETKWYSEAKPHRGIDAAPYPGSTGAPVLAPTASRVVRVGEHEFAGKEVVLESQVPFTVWGTGLDGKVVTVPAGSIFWWRLAHHSAVLVAEGVRVHAGQTVALVGSTGKYTTGPHVHLEWRVGRSYDEGQVLDPADFFAAAMPGFTDSVTHAWLGVS